MFTKDNSLKGSGTGEVKSFSQIRPLKRVYGSKTQSNDLLIPLLFKS